MLARLTIAWMSGIFLVTTCSAQQIDVPLSEAMRLAARDVPDTIPAGKTAPVALSIDQPAERDLFFGLTFDGSCDPRVSLNGEFKKGEKTTTANISVGIAVASGSCTIRSVQVEPPHSASGDQTKIIAPSRVTLTNPITFNIIGLPIVNETLPTKADAAIQLPEKLYFYKEAIPVRNLRDTLTTELDKHGADVPALQNLLLQALALADTRLHEVRKTYDEKYKGERSQTPKFFEDLDRRYKALIIDIRSHKQAAQNQTQGSEAQLVLAQLKSRPANPESSSQHVFQGTLSPDSNSTLELLDWNAWVYSRVSETGSYTFSLGLASRPPGASVFTKTIGEDYQELGSKTNVTSINFEYSFWTFKFTMPHCRDVVRQFNPSKDSSPILEVELSCGGK